MSFSLNQLLIFAARSGNAVLARERIDSGAEPNYWDPSHGSAASQAVRRADRAMLDLLLAHGLTPAGAAALSGDGLIETALYHQHDDVAVYLADHGFRLLPHARSIYRDRLTAALAHRGQSPNESKLAYPITGANEP